jgi:MFS family permease
MHNIAAAVAVFEITGSAFQVGLLVFAQFSPALILSPWAGALADRVDRRRLAVLALLLAGTSGAALAIWVGIVSLDGLPGVWPIFAASMLIGLGSAFSIPALHSIIPSLVSPRDLEGALALTTVTFNLGRTLGPAFAGGVLIWFGTPTAFALNGLSFWLFAVALTAIRFETVVERVSDGKGSVREGLRFVRGDIGLIVLLGAVASLGFAQDPVNTLAPVLAAEFGGREPLVGLLVASFGLGSVTAVVFGGRLRARMGRRTAALSGLTALGVGMLILASAPVSWIAIVGLVISGMGFLFAITSLMAGIYARVPDEFRGRVLALWTVAFLGSRPIAGLVDGAIADLASPRLAVLLAATIALSAAAMVRLGWKIDPREMTS